MPRSNKISYSLEDLLGEVWIPAVYGGISYKGGYDVSSLGRVRSYFCRGGPGRYKKLTPQRIMSQLVGRKGYLTVHFSHTPVWVHILVAESFIGPPPFKGVEVRHGDMGRQVNSVDNLKYGSHLQNMQDVPPVGSKEQVISFLHEINNNVRLREAARINNLPFYRASSILWLKRLGLLKEEIC